MYLSESEQRISDKLRLYILNHDTTECFVKCKKCQGCGLKAAIKSDGGYMWGGEYCDACKGVGYTEYKPLEGMIVCKTCHGCGCLDCNDIGVADWIIAMKNGITHWTKEI